MSFSPLQQVLIKEISTLRPGTTICPGLLARRCNTTLKFARSDIISLAEQGKILILQRGKILSANDLLTIKGPFRVSQQNVNSRLES